MHLCQWSGSTFVKPIYGCSSNGQFVPHLRVFGQVEFSETCFFFGWNMGLNGKNFALSHLVNFQMLGANQSMRNCCRNCNYESPKKKQLQTTTVHLPRSRQGDFLPFRHLLNIALRQIIFLEYFSKLFLVSPLLGCIIHNECFDRLSKARCEHVICCISPPAIVLESLATKGHLEHARKSLEQTTSLDLAAVHGGVRAAPGTNGQCWIRPVRVHFICNKLGLPKVDLNQSNRLGSLVQCKFGRSSAIVAGSIGFKASSMEPRPVS